MGGPRGTCHSWRGNPAPAMPGTASTIAGPAAPAPGGVAKGRGLRRYLEPTPVPRRHRAAWAVPLLLLSGCTLLDQRSIAPAAVAPTGAEMAELAVPPNRVALIRVRFDQPDPALKDTLRQAVEAARARKPDVVFDVVALLPPGRSATADRDAALQAGRDGLAVLQALRELGVPAAALSLGARVEPGASGRVVLVFVR